MALAAPARGRIAEALTARYYVRHERDVSVPKVDRRKLASDLKAFTDRLPYIDHRIGDRCKRN